MFRTRKSSDTDQCSAGGNFAGILLLFGIAEMAALMKETIMAPIFKLVHASQKIAANDLSGMLRWTTRMSLVNWSGRSIK